jgi:hypothetical protein
MVTSGVKQCQPSGTVVVILQIESVIQGWLNYYIFYLVGVYLWYFL